MFSDLPDPDELSKSLEEIHQETIDITKAALQEVLLTPENDEKDFVQPWLSDRAKDMFRRADQANFERAPQRALELYNAFKKVARHEKRVHIAHRVQEGEWARTKPFRAKLQMGSIYVMDAEANLRDATDRA